MHINHSMLAQPENFGWGRVSNPVSTELTRLVYPFDHRSRSLVSLCKRVTKGRRGGGNFCDKGKRVQCVCAQAKKIREDLKSRIDGLAKFLIRAPCTRIPPKNKGM